MVYEVSASILAYVAAAFLLGPWGRCVVSPVVGFAGIAVRPSHHPYSTSLKPR